MRLTNAGAYKMPPNVSFWEVGSDGKDVFSVDHYAAQPSPIRYYDQRTKHLFSTNMTISPQVRVDPGAVPHYRVNLASYIWLAFASGCVLQENTTGRLRQVWNFDDSNLEYTDYTMPGRWALLNKGLSLPQSVVYYNEGTYFGNVKGRSVHIKAPYPFGNGWTNAIYAVRSVTNLDSLAFPLTATFSRFAPRLKTGSNSNDLAVITAVDINVSCWCFTNIEEPHLPSLAHLSTAVADNRFQPNISLPINYVPKGQWLSVEQVKALPNYSLQYRYAREAKHGPSRPSGAVIAYAAFVVIIVFPIALWIRRAFVAKTTGTRAL
jgi:hypothetical protein